MLDNTLNKPSNVGQDKLVDIIDHAHGKCSFDCQVKTTMLKSRLRDFIDTNILLNWIITINEAGVDDLAKQLDKRNKVITFLHHSLTL